MSARGLFRFTGIARSTGQRLIGAMFPLAQHTFPEALERWNTISIYHENIQSPDYMTGSSAGRIIKAEFCADFCAYIAYEDSRPQLNLAC
jgi:hypothetical protein